MLVLLGYGLSPSTWRHRFESGLAWDETPYGYGQAEEYYELTWAADHPESLLGKTFRRAVQRVLGFDWVHVWRNRQALFNCDVVWTHTEREHLAVAAVKLLYPHRAHFKSLAQTVWMWDEWPSYGRARKALVRNLIRRHDVEALHSRLNLARSRFEVPGRVVLLLPFGTASVPAPQRTTPQAKPPLIVAAGNDRDRDWESLARAATEVPEARFRVYSSSRGAEACTWPPNVQLLPAASVADMAAAYYAASAVVIPLQPNLHASGNTVANEAMSVGVPVVISDVGGVGDYVSGQGCLLVAPHDPGGLADALRLALSRDRESIQEVLQQRRRSRGLTQQDYVLRYVWLTDWLLGEGPAPGQASEFSSVPPPPTRPCTS